MIRSKSLNSNDILFIESVNSTCILISYLNMFKF